MTALSIIVSTSFRLYDTDLWSALAIGRTMWTERAIPHVDLWTRRIYGEPQIVPSWLFRVLLWPLWSEDAIRQLEKARMAYLHELNRDPLNAEARDSLAAIGSATGK